MNKILNDAIEQQVQQAFQEMQLPVQILFFGSQDHCEYCEDTLQLLEEVVALSEKIGLSSFDLNEDLELANQFRIDKNPAFVIVSANKDGTFTDTGIQYSGVPSGHEFSTLIQDILLVSGRNSGLKAATREFLKTLQKPIHLQVFVTPTCPYCPRAVILAHQMALENPSMIRADGIESMEFQTIAQQFSVSGVPQTTINNGAGTVIGAVPEDNLLAEIQRVMA